MKNKKLIQKVILAFSVLLCASLCVSPVFVFAEDKINVMQNNTLGNSQTSTNENIQYKIVPDSASLGTTSLNIQKQSDREYTILYPGATIDSPVHYQEDFVNFISHITFSADIKNLDGSSVEKPKPLNMNKSNWDYSTITQAVGDGTTIPSGTYTTTVDLSKITNTEPLVKKWKEIAFEDGTQIITINVIVGTTWADDSQFEPYKIKTVSPENVTFNLFDYWVDGQTAHTHPFGSINSKKTFNTFITCGIPNCTGETSKVLNGESPNYNVTNFYNKGINKNHALVFSSAGPDSGGWNFNTNNPAGDSYDQYNGGPYTGLVQNTLGSDGFPVLNLNQNDVNSKKAFIGQNRPANESLSYLFSLDETEGKKVYKDEVTPVYWTLNLI